jgi:hypothetical protein
MPVYNGQAIPDCANAALTAVFDKPSDDLRVTLD